MREVCLGSLRENEQRDVRVVVDRRRVRHACDRRESTGNRRCDATRHSLLVLLTWFAQVHVHVDQPGTDDKAGWNLDDRGAIGRQIPTDASDAAVLDEDVVHAIDPIRGIDDMPALKQPLHVQLRPPGDTAPPSAPRRRSRPGRG